MAVEILELAIQMERVINELSEGLKTGVSDGQEIKVKLSNKADEAGILKSANRSKTIDDIYADISAQINSLVVDDALATLPDGTPNSNFHQNISAFLQGKFKDNVVNETYARVVGDSDKYPDGDKILNTFKELQELIGTADSKAVDAATILSRLSQLSEAINTARTELEAQISQTAQQFQQSINTINNGLAEAAQGIYDTIGEMRVELSTFTTQNETEHSNLNTKIDGIENTLKTKISEVEVYAQGVKGDLNSFSSKYSDYINAVGTAFDFANARQKLEAISIKRIWSI